MAINRISVAKNISSPDAQFVLLPFYKDGSALSTNAPRWGITLRKALSMRFRWNEHNAHREQLLSDICSRAPDAQCTPVSLELIHSKTVYDLHAPGDTHLKTGDGMITAERALVPVVTVADCMPLFLYDASGRTGVFGVFHSGWKGTGIVAEGISLACTNYGARTEDLCVAIGPHIQQCCYIVDEARAAYFADTFCSSCVQPTHEYNEKGSRLYTLSLLEANLSVLRNAGIRDCNIVAAADCTCCTQIAGVVSGAPYYPFGSFRRQAAFMPPALSADSRSRLMTVQAAFCGWL